MADTAIQIVVAGIAIEPVIAGSPFERVETVETQEPVSAGAAVAFAASGRGRVGNRKVDEATGRAVLEGPATYVDLQAHDFVILDKQIFPGLEIRSAL